MNARLFGPPGEDFWSRVRGRTFGAMVCFGFGAYSLCCLISAIRAKQAWSYAVITIAAALAACAIAQLVALRRAPRSTMSRQAIISYNAWFAAVVATEVAGIILGGPILAHLHRSELYANWVAAVVGIHFLPLGKLFKMPIYYATGVAITLAAVGSLLISEAAFRVAVCSVGAGLTLWVTGLMILYENRSILTPEKAGSEVWQQ